MTFIKSQVDSVCFTVSSQLTSIANTDSGSSTTSSNSSSDASNNGNSGNTNNDNSDFAKRQENDNIQS